MDDFALDTDADQIALKNAKAADAAEAPAEVEEPAAVEEAPVVEDVATDERLRNPDGTFAANEPAAEETPAEKLYAGKYKSADELERAYQELQSHAGRQGSEISELRQAFETRLSQIDERLATPPAPPVQITAELIESNPGYASQLAYEQDNGTAFAIAFETWQEMEPFKAAAWANAKTTEAQIAELSAKYEERLDAVQSQLGPVAKSTDAAVLNSLLTQAEAKTPGLTEFVLSDKVAQVAQEFPDEAELLLNGTPDQKARSLQKLFLIDGGRNRDTLQATTEQVGRATAIEAEKVREESFVASATTASSGVKPSRADEIAASWDEIDKPYNDGWQV